MPFFGFQASACQTKKRADIEVQLPYSISHSVLQTKFTSNIDKFFAYPVGLAEDFRPYMKSEGFVIVLDKRVGQFQTVFKIKIQKFGWITYIRNIYGRYFGCLQTADIANGVIIRDQVFQVFNRSDKRFRILDIHRMIHKFYNGNQFLFVKQFQIVTINQTNLLIDSGLNFKQ